MENEPTNLPISGQLSFSDRLARALFVALAVGICWAIRGTFGHLIGAMLPGAALGLGFAYVSGQRSLFRWMPIVGALTGLLIGLGGHMSYGMLHGYAKADSLENYAYGFFTLFLQGGAWGIFGCAAVGLLLESKPLREVEWASLIITILICGYALYAAVVVELGFHINPGRSNASITFTGGAIGLFGWLALNKKSYGLRGAIFGYLGFGFGMSFGRLLGNACHFLPLEINNWNIMEYSAGFFGGLVFTLGMLGKRVDEPPAGHRLLSVYGIFYCLAGIPLLHRLARIDEERRADWLKKLTSYEYVDPTAMGETVLMLLNGICLVALVAAALWLFLYFADKHGLGAFPVMALCGLMLLFENVHSLYFFAPHQEDRLETRWLWWGSYAVMGLYMLLVRPKSKEVPDEVVERVPWKRAAVAGLALYGLTLVLAHYVNGEKTMGSANTRFPIWSWRDGPPPK